MEEDKKKKFLNILKVDLWHLWYYYNDIDQIKSTILKKIINKNPSELYFIYIYKKKQLNDLLFLSGKNNIFRVNINNFF
jgi:hypothetical protein